MCGGADRPRFGSDRAVFETSAGDTDRAICTARPGEDDPEVDQVRGEHDARDYVKEFHLPRELSIKLVAGYSIVLRRRIVARWSATWRLARRSAAFRRRRRTGKEHKNLLANIRRMLLELGKGSAQFSADVRTATAGSSPG